MEYLIYNAARNVQTKAARLASPHRRGLCQFVCNNRYRLTRNRAVKVTEEVVRECLDELKREVKNGRIVVRSTDGRPLDLETFTLGPAPAPEGPPPDPPIDSAANDLNPEPFLPPAFAGDGPPPEDLEEIMVPDDSAEEEEVPIPSAPSGKSGKGGKHRR
jgi:hypothetical protein